MAKIYVSPSAEIMQISPVAALLQASAGGAIGQPIEMDIKEYNYEELLDF